jgi:hypothetical protein
MNYFFVFLCLFFAGLPSLAGVQGVGKGGGFGEMQAIYSNLKMRELTHVCFQDTNPCDLTEAQAEELAAASSVEFDLVLDPTCTHQEIQVLAHNKAQISSCRLYTLGLDTLGPRVKSFREIAGLVLATRLVASQNESEVRALALSEKIFLNMTQENQSLAISLSTGNYLIHANHLAFRSSDQILFSVEGHSITHDLTASVDVSLLCPLASTRPLEVRLSGATTNDNRQALIQGDVHWVCANGARYRGELQVFFETEAAEIKAGSIQVRIVGKERL